MKYKLKFLLSTTIGLILVSIIPLSIINSVNFNNTIISSNKNMQQQSNTQKTNSIDNIIFGESNSAQTVFAIVADIEKGDRLYGWGNNTSGELGLGNTTPRMLVPTLITIPNYSKEHRVTSVVAGKSASALVINNELYLTGSEKFGQQGNGADSRHVSTFTKLNQNWGGNIKQVFAGHNYFLLLTENHQLWGWGNNAGYQLMDNNGSNANVLAPKLLSTTSIGEISEIGGGETWAWALNSNNELFMWGSDDNGAQGDGVEIKHNITPVKINLGVQGEISQVASSWKTMYVVVNNNLLYGWGYCSNGQLGIQGSASGSGPAYKYEPEKIGEGSNMKIVDVVQNRATISYGGKIYTTGQNEYGELGLGHAIRNISKFTELTLTNINTDVLKYNSTNDATIIIDNNKIYAWGLNNHAQYGNGTSGGTSSGLSFNRPTLVDSFGSAPSKFIFKDTNNAIAAQFAFDEIYNGQFNEEAFRKYVDCVNFLPNTTFTLKGIPTVNNNDRLIKLTLTVNQSYTEPDAAKNISSFDYIIEINNFLSGTNIDSKTIYDKAKSAKQAYDYLSNNITIAKLEEYTEIFRKPANLTDADITINQTNSENDINNITGELKFNVVLTNHYDVDGNTQVSPKSFPITLNGFIKDSSIKVRDDYSEVAANISVLDLINKIASANVDTLTTILQSYLIMNFTSQFAPNIAAKITNVIIDENGTNNGEGKIKLIVYLSNYYENGLHKDRKEFTLTGFMRDPNFNIEVKQDFNKAFSPKQLLAYLKNSIGNVDLLKLNEYINTIGLPNDAIISIISSNINPNNDGTLMLKLSTNKWYEYGFLQTTNKPFEFLLTGLIKNSSITSQTNINFIQSAKQAYKSFANYDGTIKNLEKVEQYINLSMIDEQTNITKITLNEQKANTIGQMELNIKFTNFYKNGDLQNSLALTINGFIADTFFDAFTKAHTDMSPQQIYESFAKSDNTLRSLTELSKYVDLSSLDPRTKINSFLPIFNNEQGSFLLTANFTNAYKNGDPINTLSTTIIQIPKAATFTFKSEPFPLSPQQAFDSFINVADNSVNLLVLKHYINITGTTSINGIEKIIIDNTQGILAIKLILSNTFDNQGNPITKSQMLVSNKFVRNANITPVASQYNISANEMVQKINESKNASEKELMVKQYAHIDIDSQTIMDWDNIIATSENLAGTVSIQFNQLTNFYVNGVLKLDYTIKLTGFAINTVIMKKSTIGKYNETASEVTRNVLSKGEVKNLDILGKYVDLISVPEKSIITIINSTHNDSDGEITLDFEVLSYYKEGELTTNEKMSFLNIKVLGFKSIATTSSNNYWWIYVVAGSIVLAMLVLGTYFYLKKRSTSITI